MTQSAVVIKQVTEEQALGANNAAKTVLRVQYTIGEHGPFYERFDKEGFTAAAAMARLQSFAAQLAQLPTGV